MHDRWHGEFHLDHCGALLDVEPMGEDYVRGMCHDIEDPTFDATAVATNPRARVRPVHRPPRTPADRAPHCRWTVVIDESHPPVTESPDCTALRGSGAATLELTPSELEELGERFEALLDEYRGGAKRGRRRVVVSFQAVPSE